MACSGPASDTGPSRRKRLGRQADRNGERVVQQASGINRPQAWRNRLLPLLHSRPTPPHPVCTRQHPQSPVGGVGGRKGSAPPLTPPYTVATAVRPMEPPELAAAAEAAAAAEVAAAAAEGEAAAEAAAAAAAAEGKPPPAARVGNIFHF